MCHAEREVRFGEKFWQTDPDHIERTLTLFTGDAEQARRVSNDVHIEREMDKLRATLGRG